MASGKLDLRLAVISDGFPLWPLHVAQSRGLFEAEGLDVAVTVTSSSIKQMDGLEQGDFDVGIQLPDHVVRAVSGGSDLFAFMAPVHAPDINFIVEPHIRRLSDLRGQVIAVDGARSGYALLLRSMLRAHGISDADCPFTEFGGTKERLDALMEGRAVAAFINPPFDTQLLDQGFSRLTSTREAFPSYPGPLAAARRSWADGHEVELRRFVRAYRKAYGWLTDPRNRDDAIAIAIAKLPVDQAHAAAAWDELAPLAEPELSETGMRQVIDVVWEGDAITQAKPGTDTLIDSRYVNSDELLRNSA